MGRAFPELQMFGPFIYGLKPYPAAVADNKGNAVVCTHVDSAERLEDFFRGVCVKMDRYVGDGVCDFLCVPACSLFVSYYMPTRLVLTLTHTHTRTHAHTHTYIPHHHHPYPPSKIAGTTFGVMTMSEMKEKCIFFSMCHAWQLGRAVLRAQHTHTNVLDAIKDQQKGTILITGKVSLCRGAASPPPPLALYPGSFLYWYLLFLCSYWDLG